jgi:hypothetical protein
MVFAVLLVLRSMQSDPLIAAEQQAQELGYPKNDIQISGGGHTSKLLSMSAHLRFHSIAHPEYGEIYLRISRPTPFHRWQLREFSMENQSEAPMQPPD